MKMKPCPFCGMEQDPDDQDTVYPSGSAWVDDEEIGVRHYVSAMQVPKEQWCYNVICNPIYGGCGAEMHGDSREEAIDNWNRRIDQSLQAKIDRLMLEYCPDEMTEEQLEIWKANQKPIAWLDPTENVVCTEVGYDYTITAEHPKDLGWIPLTKSIDI